MDTIERKTVCVIAALLLPCFIASCQEQYVTGRGVEGLETPTDLGATIGSLVEVVYPESIPVEGYGVVGGLNGTGSAACPPQIRTYLTQYILKKLPAGRYKKPVSPGHTSPSCVYDPFSSDRSKRK